MTDPVSCHGSSIASGSGVTVSPMAPGPYPRLQQMFGAFFHQDWDLEGGDWPDLVRNYGADLPAEELEATAAEVEVLLRDVPRDEDLQRRVFDELWCCYHPRPDLGGPSVRERLVHRAAVAPGRARVALPRGLV